MSSSGWGSVIQWSIWVVLMVAVTGWIARSRSRAAASESGDQLRQPVSTLVVGMTAFLFFAAIAVISNVIANETTTWWTMSIFVGFAALSAWLIASYYVERHDMSEAGMRHRSLLGGTTELAWSDVASVRYSSRMKWFRLELASGKVVRVTALTMNLPGFARLIRLHAGSARIDGGTEAVLRRTEAGELPPV